MADASDIAEVRSNVDEPDDSNGFTDAIIGALIDADGVAGASAKIWYRKAATFASSVDVTEAGASHKNSDIHKNMLTMAKVYDTFGEGTTVISDRPVIRQIER